MKEINEIQALTDLYNILGLIVPEGTQKTIDIDGAKINIQRDNNSIKISINSETNLSEDWDSSDIIKLVTEFNESIKELDDSIFSECLDKASKAIDIKRFSYLLSLKDFTKSEAIEIGCLIDYFTQLIEVTLKRKIAELTEISEKF